MVTSRAKMMVLIYDIRDHIDRYKRFIPPFSENRWQSYLWGELEVSIIEGDIETLYVDNWGHPLFTIVADSRLRRDTFLREGDDSHYVVGCRAKIERAIFSEVGQPIVTKIWIEKGDA
jgi:hypothetical protein